MWNTNVRLDELVQVVPAFAPVDMSTGSGPTSDWVSMKYYGRCMILYTAAVGTAGGDTTLTFSQATDVSGTAVKALNISSPARVKSAVDITGVGTFTDVATSGNTFTDDTSGESQLVWLFDIKAEDLDIAGGFDCIRVAANDHSSAKIGTVQYILYDAKYVEDPMPSAIVN